MSDDRVRAELETVRTKIDQLTDGEREFSLEVWPGTLNLLRHLDRQTVRGASADRTFKLLRALSRRIDQAVQAGSRAPLVPGTDVRVFNRDGSTDVDPVVLDVLGRAITSIRVDLPAEKLERVLRHTRMIVVHRTADWQGSIAGHYRGSTLLAWSGAELPADLGATLLHESDHRDLLSVYDETRQITGDPAPEVPPALRRIETRNSPDLFLYYLEASAYLENAVYYNVLAVRARNEDRKAESREFGAQASSALYVVNELLKVIEQVAIPSRPDAAKTLEERLRATYLEQTYVNIDLDPELSGARLAELTPAAREEIDRLKAALASVGPADEVLVHYEGYEGRKDLVMDKNFRAIYPQVLEGIVRNHQPATVSALWEPQGGRLKVTIRRAEGARLADAEDLMMRLSRLDNAIDRAARSLGTDAEGRLFVDRTRGRLDFIKDLLRGEEYDPAGALRALESIRRETPAREPFPAFAAVLDEAITAARQLAGARLALPPAERARAARMKALFTEEISSLFNDKERAQLDEAFETLIGRWADAGQLPGREDRMDELIERLSESRTAGQVIYILDNEMTDFNYTYERPVTLAEIFRSFRDGFEGQADRVRFSRARGGDHVLAPKTATAVRYAIYELAKNGLDHSSDGKVVVRAIELEGGAAAVEVSNRGRIDWAKLREAVSREAHAGFLDRSASGRLAISPDKAENPVSPEEAERLTPLEVLSIESLSTGDLSGSSGHGLGMVTLRDELSEAGAELELSEARGRVTFRITGLTSGARLAGAAAPDDLAAQAAPAELAQRLRSVRSERVETQRQDRRRGELDARLRTYLGRLEGIFGATALAASELPLQLEGPAATIFRFETTPEGLRAVAKDADGTDIAIPLAGARQQSRDQDQASDGPSLQDLRTLESDVTDRVLGAVEALPVRSEQAVVVELDTAFLDDRTYERYADHLITSLRTARRSPHLANVHYVAVGPYRERLLALQGLGELISAERPSGLEEAPTVLVGPARGLRSDRINLPVGQVSEGDVPAFTAMLVLSAVAGRLDPSAVPDAFSSAYATLAGERPDSLDLRRILEGRAELELVLRYALKPIARVPINQALRYFELMKRMVEQAA